MGDECDCSHDPVNQIIQDLDDHSRLARLKRPG